MSKPEIAQESPIGVDVEEGKSYFWCACGRSSTQPFCDGSHKGSNFVPQKYTTSESGKKYFCCCKQSAGAPLCDGSHNDLS